MHAHTICNIFNHKMFPLRQKIFIGLTLLTGIALIFCSVFNLLIGDTLNLAILFYGVGVPLFLLMFETIIDLNDRKIFGIWLAISLVFLIVSLTTYTSEKFIIQRNASFEKQQIVNNLFFDYSTSSLKALLLFLAAYWFLNKFLNKKGLFIINTFKQAKWYHNVAQREISGIDVATNLILYAVIIAAVLFGH